MKDKDITKAIVLFSGGQDSTTCLVWALNHFDQVIPVGFDYGQSHVKELEQAKIICESLGVDYHIFDIKGLLAKSSLTEHSDHNEKSYVDDSLPASFTSGRNLLFLTVAASFGVQFGINDIVTGVCQTDYSGYPDCRRTTIDAMQNTLSLGMGNGDFRIHTPLMYLTKAETWKMAFELNCLDLVIEHSMTDYNGSMTKHDWGYGDPDNPATKLRMKGFYEAINKGWIPTPVNK